MEHVEVSTVVYIPPEEAYDFLVDFPRYAAYSKHLERVDQQGDGGPGTEYRLHFSWWKLGYTAHSRVTDVDRPNRIDWTVTRDVDARGAWLIEDVADEHPGREAATRVTLSVAYDTDSVDPGVVDLPALVSLGWVTDRVVGLVEKEGERVVERVVADLEGERRPVDLEVRTDYPSA